MKNIVGVEKGRYIYRGEVYEDTGHINLNRKLGSYREVIIMGEALWVKVYSFSENETSIEKFVEDIITKEFLAGEDLLFHYEFIKLENKVYIYSIKKGVAVEKITIGAKNLDIVPVQFKIKELINNKLKKYRNFIAITKIRGIYYLINVEGGLIINGLVNENIDVIFNELPKYININKEIIVDREINIKENNKDEYLKNIQYLKIGEIVDEKLFKKQKFYTKKIS